MTVDFSVLAPHGPQQQTAVMRGILSAPSGPGHSLLLRHPLLETFLRLKWQRLRFFFFTLLFVYLCFLLSLSGYVTVIHLQYEKLGSQVKLVLKLLLICFSSILLVHVVIQAVLLPAYYIKSFETWVIALCSSLSLVLVSYTSDDTKPQWWVQHLTSFTTLLAWTELMLFTGRFPKWGNYALMFYTVLRNVLRVLLTFVCIVVGFSLSFFVQFDKNPIFNNPWKAFVKTMVMMTGEFEYQDLFKENATEGAFEMKHAERLPITSRVIFLTFVILASIVMMNLMVGLAVSDIQGIQAEGHLRRLLKQAEFVDHLETIMSHKFFNQLFPRCLLSLLSKRKSIVTLLTLQPSAVERRKRRPHNLPHRLLEACVELAVRRRAMSVLKSNNEELWCDFTNAGQRLSWYVDQSDGLKNTAHNSNANRQTNSASPGIDELLLRVSSDLRMIKEILGGPIESAHTSRQASPITMRSNLLRVPRVSSQHNSIMDVVSELQGAHCMLRRLGRTSRSDWA